MFPFLNTHRLQGIKVAVVGADGNYPDGHVPGEVYWANVPGPYQVAGTGFIAPQNSVCVTLTTAKPRGLASKGRFYLPPMYIGIQADGLINDNHRDLLVGDLHDFLTGINNATLDAGDIAIFSRGKGLPAYDAVHHKVTYTYPNAGSSNDVTAVRVGRVIDTQRRRRRQLVESPEGVPLG
jgi:hypothetical protein